MKLPACCSCPADAVPVPLYQGDRASRAKFQAGVALITVLLIVFLASIAAISLASLQQLAIRRSTVLLHQQQARLYTLGAEQWAMVILARGTASGAKPTIPARNGPSLPPALPIEDGTLAARLVDQQSVSISTILWRPAPGGQSPSPNTPREDKEKQKPQDPEADTEPKPDQPSPNRPNRPNRMKPWAKRHWNRRRSRCCSACWKISN